MDNTESTPKKTGLARLRNSKGFSLIEIAIVLVIIGIIIAAIIKGQDLIGNSQAKKVVSSVSQWRNLTMAFLDRNGRYPGDQVKNGIISDQAGELTNALSAIGEIAPIMEQVPDNPIILGSTSLWVYMGNTTTTNSGARNAILICGTVDCATAFTVDQIEMIKSVDTAIDGSADGGAGAFRAVTTAATLAQAATAVNGRMTTTFTGAGVAAVVNTTASGSAPWTAGTNTAAVWLFDKNF